jgi:hypothetical protein
MLACDVPDLMKRCPELMNTALLMHNAAMRKCKWANYGFTVEQEGDSYTIVFHVRWVWGAPSLF